MRAARSPCGGDGARGRSQPLRSEDAESPRCGEKYIEGFYDTERISVMRRGRLSSFHKGMAMAFYPYVSGWDTARICLGGHSSAKG